MVKAKRFWNYLCEELDYRFFSGVACLGLSPLYKKMNKDIMHYVPAANERIALGLISGAYMGGFKGGLLMDMKFKYDIITLLNFNLTYKIPFVIIGYSESDKDKLIYDLPTTTITDDGFEDDIKRVTSESESKSIPGLIVIKDKEISV
jgi:sulfopyruvate decarboxylase TPP-binding subunit